MTSCPNCGFDLTSAGTCGVCGFGHDEPAPKGSPSAPAVASGRRRVVYGAIGAGALCLAAAVIVVAVSVAARPSAAQRATGRTERATVAAPGADAAGEGVRTAGSSRVATASPRAQEAGAAASISADASAAVQPSIGVTSAVHMAEHSPQTLVPPSGTPGGTVPGELAGSSAAARAATAEDLYDPPTAPVFDLAKRTAYPPLTSEDAYVSWMLQNTNQDESFLKERWERAQIAAERRHITHERILLGFLLTPREWFVRSFNLARTYENTALPIGYGQTISGPDLVARMTDYLDPQPDQKVLEIGTGSGYQSAFLSELSNYVYTIEIVTALGKQTNQIYLDHTATNPEYGNIHRRLADGYYGWPEYAPFDRIIVTAGIDHIPPELLKELKTGGIMVIPIGPPTGQTILKITKNVDKDGNVTLTREDIYHGHAMDIFVPFTTATGGTHYTAGASKN